MCRGFESHPSSSFLFSEKKELFGLVEFPVTGPLVSDCLVAMFLAASFASLMVEDVIFLLKMVLWCPEGSQ